MDLSLIAVDVMGLLLDSVGVCDLESRVLYMNAACVELLGRNAASEVVGRVFWDLYPEAVGTKFYQVFMNVVDGGPGQRFVHYFEPYGLWFDTQIAPVPQGVCVIGRDITERFKAVEALRASERLYRAIGESIDYGVWVCDAGGRNTYASESFLRLVGLTQGQWSEFGWRQALHPDEAAHLRQAWDACVREGRPWDYELRLRGRDGQWHPILSRGVPVRDERGGIACWAGINLDISRLKHAEHERKVMEEAMLAAERAARTEAEHVSHMKDEFLATLSHELRAPLNAIVGWTQLLRRGRQNAEGVARGLDIIERNTWHQSELVSELLDMSRIVSGKLRLKLDRVDIDSVVGAAVDSYRPTADAKQVALHHEGSAGPAIVADEGRLRQVVSNLLSNAIKFTPSGGRVDVRVTRRDVGVEIQVKDTGQGISPEFLPFVFERFRQADPTSARPHGGLGLGLSIARHLMELHGGMLTVASDGEGKGATFTAKLPAATTRAKADDVLQPLVAPDASMSLEARLLSGLRVLVVDDQPDARELVQRLLEERNAVVATAASAGEALATIAKHPPDVLVSDISMPLTDGYELIRLVRELPPSRGGNLPAVALTAFARDEDRARAYQAGYQAHVSKPLNASVLYATIARVVERARRPP